MKKPSFRVAIFMTSVLLRTALLVLPAMAQASPEPFYSGLSFLYGFNHGAAIRSFQEATRLDPTFAMAHWGIALACGPHINFPLVPLPAAELAWKELALAKENASSASPVECDLIEALAKRYANPQPENRVPLDQAYADAESITKVPAEETLGNNTITAIAAVINPPTLFIGE